MSERGRERGRERERKTESEREREKGFESERESESKCVRKRERNRVSETLNKKRNGGALSSTFLKSLFYIKPPPKAIFFRGGGVDADQQAYQTSNVNYQSLPSGAPLPIDQVKDSQILDA